MLQLTFSLQVEMINGWIKVITTSSATPMPAQDLGARVFGAETCKHSVKFFESIPPGEYL
jgi:hypothetical protein